jgi:hypothetical protein
MRQSLFPFSIRSEFADGQSLKFVPTAVRPFGLSELTALSLQSDASVSLHCLTDNAKINGDTVGGTAKMEGRG